MAYVVAVDVGGTGIKSALVDSDLNIVMFDDMSIVEIQGTAEKNSIPRDTLNVLIDLAEIGVQSILQFQI